MKYNIYLKFVYVSIMLLFTYSFVIAAEKKFIITTSPWVPFIGVNLKNRGWTMEVAKAALELQGYSVTLRLVPWKRAVLESRLGDADGLYLSYYVKEREQWFVFSKPIGQLRTGFFALKERNISYTTLHDVKNYTIGLTRGAAVSIEFDNADYLLKEETTDDLASLGKLLLKRIDLFAGPELVAKYFIQTNFSLENQKKFEFLEPALATQNLYLAISKKAPDYQQKLKDFNHGLQQIRANGMYGNILKRHGFQ